MGRSELLRLVSIFVSVILAVIAFLNKDFYWIIVVLVCILLMTYPSRRSAGFDYSPKIVIPALVTMLAQIAFMSITMVTGAIDGMYIMDAPLYHYISAFFMSIIGFTSGLMFMTVLDRGCDEFSITKRWLVLYAMMFSLTISVGSLFFDFVYLYAQGYPVFNLDVANASDRASNNMMMVAPNVCTFASAIYAIITVRMLRGKTKDALIVEEGIE